VVHYFEIVKEKWPAEEMPFDKIVLVAFRLPFEAADSVSLVVTRWNP